MSSANTKLFLTSQYRRGNDFLVGGGQKLVKNNQNNQTQSITFCNM